MLLVLSITFHCHCNIWGCMCSTHPFQYIERYIYSSCYYHHQIGSINLTHCYQIFPWFCAWDVCYIICCHLLHIHSRKTGIFSSRISFVMIERIYTLCCYHHPIGSMTYYPLFRARPWNNGVHCMSLYIVLTWLVKFKHYLLVFRNIQSRSDLKKRF